MRFITAILLVLVTSTGFSAWAAFQGPCGGLLSLTRFTAFYINQVSNLTVEFALNNWDLLVNEVSEFAYTAKDLEEGKELFRRKFAARTIEQMGDDPRISSLSEQSLYVQAEALRGSMSLWTTTQFSQRMRREFARNLIKIFWNDPDRARDRRRDVERIQPRSLQQATE